VQQPVLDRDDRTLNLPEVSVQIKPNPFNSRILAMITLSKPQHVTIAISDITGRLIKTHSANLSAGISQIEMRLDYKPMGMYFIKVEGKDFIIAKKVVKGY
jgi:hypothetical protein